MKKISLKSKTFITDRKSLTAQGLRLDGGFAGIPCRIVKISNSRLVVAQVVAVIDNDRSQTSIDRIQSIEECYDTGHEDHYLTLRKYGRFDHIKQIVCRSI